MTLKHEGVEIRNHFVSSFDGIADKRRDFRVHPRFDDTADCVVVFICFETVDCEARGMAAELDPSEEKLWTWLWTFEAADVVAITLIC